MLREVSRLNRRHSTYRAEPVKSTFELPLYVLWALFLSLLEILPWEAQLKRLVENAFTIEK